MNIPSTEPGGAVADVRQAMPTQAVSGRAVLISDASPEDATCIACMIVAFLVAIVAITVAVHLDGRFSAEAIPAFIGCFLLTYTVLNILQIEQARGNFSRVMLAREALWIRTALGDFQRVPLTGLIRARTIVGGGARPVRSIRIDCVMPDGRLHHFDFLPHASHRFDARDSNPLCDELMALAEAARARRRTTASVADETAAFLDFRAVLSPSGGSREDGHPGVGDVPSSPAIGDRLSENDAYMQRWYPLHWLLAPSLVALLGLLAIALRFEGGWGVLALAMMFAPFQFDLFRRASAGLVREVAIDGERLRYRRKGRPGAVDLGAVVDMSDYYTRYYLGRTPVTVRYIDGDRIREIRFIARRDRKWWNLLSPSEAMRALGAAVQRAYEKGGHA